MEKGGALVQFDQALNRSLASRFGRSKHEDLHWAAEKQYALALIASNEKLQKCTTESTQMALLDVAFTGLSLNPVMAHAYLIPYWNEGLKINEMTFRPSYRGLEHLVHRAGTIKSIQTVLVRSADKFRVETKDNRRIVTHVENSNSKHKVTAAYCILHYSNGGEYVEVMDIDDLEAVKAQAKKKGGGAVWDGPWYGEMCRKAVLRRALKHAPLDNGGHMAHALAVHDKYHPVDFDNKPVDREQVEELISKEQQLAAHAFLTERDIAGAEADVWLQRLADAMGFESFDRIPVKHYEEAMGRLKARYEKCKVERGRTAAA